MMGHREELKTVDEDETVYRDRWHRHNFHQIKKRMMRRNRHERKQELRGLMCG